MRYRLKLDEPVADGIRRIGIAQIDRAAKALSEQDRDTGIHEARKCFKRVRALLDMSRPALPAKVYKRENRRFRDLGRALAGPRDIHVMRQTLDTLADRRDLAAAGETASALRVWLDAKRLQVVTSDSDAATSQAQRVLAEARAAFGNIPFKAKDVSPLTEGVRDIYANGRKAMKHAYRIGADDVTFHDWRKHVQRHWRHLQLVRNAWPEVIAPRIALASDLSELIGKDHDLAVLITFIRRNRAILGPRGEVKALIQEARAQQAVLRTAAFQHGQRLYALPPSALEDMLRAYWSAAQHIQTTTEPAETFADHGNVVKIAS